MVIRKQKSTWNNPGAFLCWALNSFFDYYIVLCKINLNTMQSSKKNSLAEMERFELSCRLLDKRISSASRYDHFGTTPYCYLDCDNLYILAQKMAVVKIYVLILLSSLKMFLLYIVTNNVIIKYGKSNFIYLGVCSYVSTISA